MGRTDDSLGLDARQQISRLPTMLIAGQPCGLPLSEPTASALLFALLCSGDSDDGAVDAESEAAVRTLLIESLSLDPALALWAAVHHAQIDSAREAPPTIAELAEFLLRRLPTIVRAGANEALASASADSSSTPAGKAAMSRRRPKTRRAPNLAEELAPLAAAAVLDAIRTAPAAATASAAKYLAVLLHGAGDWLAHAGLSHFEPTDLPPWLARSLGEPTTPAVARNRTTRSRGKPARKPRSVLPTAGQRALAQAAADRWLVPAGLASRQFAHLAARLARLIELESNFAEKLLEEKLHALGEFAAGAGHEINNPLAVISGRAQLFLRHEADPQRRRELAVINTQARRVHEMIADLMLFARPPQPRTAPCDVQAIVDAVLCELAPRAAERQIALRLLEASDPRPTVTADATQLAVAVRAVIENALDAAPDGSTIEIGVERRNIAHDNSALQFAHSASPASVTVGQVPADSAVAIVVRDDGPGIDAAARRNLFDPFFSGRGAGRGVGMGLSKCWRIITAHGGRMEIDNRPNGGACVTILLPV